MKITLSLKSKPLIRCLAISTTLFIGILPAEDLDDLLNPAGSAVKSENNNALEAWTGVVEAFRKNDLDKAKELGTAFLAASHKTSPYQLLGVKVMMDIANADKPMVTRDVGLTEEMKRLMAERETIRVKYANLQKIVQDADARINKLTKNRTEPVQVGTAAYRECARAALEMQQANAKMEEMKPEIAENKLKVGNGEVEAKKNLKDDTLKLLDMLIEANEIEAAFAITNVYIRVVGSDLEVAKKQNDVIRLREEQQKADKIVAAITAEIEPLTTTGKGGEALSKLQTLIAKVESSSQNESVKKMSLSKLQALVVKVSQVEKLEKREQALASQKEKRAQALIAQNSEEISERLITLEAKLEAAQQSFSTVIRSIEGFSEYSGEFTSEIEKEKTTASINEKIKSGMVSKEKVDNMLKAKAEHVGILHEVQTLQTEVANLSPIQKGRLANLNATSKTGLELLSKIAP
jgi:DNA repair exonuclease SbcCD ATPase subunit